MFLEVHQPTQVITFHALRLDVTRVTIKLPYGVTISPQVKYLDDSQAAFVELEEEMPLGYSAIMKVEYVGQMTEPGSMGGLYPVPYRMPDGDIKLGFETMMQPTMARAVFPCLDEPNFKATFKISMVVDSELTCLSNMEISSQESITSHTGESKKMVIFSPTPTMSTYLVALVAGYFNVLESDEFHVPVRVWAPVDKDIRNASFALDITVEALRAHEANFGLKYPLPKLDMVAIPGHTGGMEHWGCVTCEEHIILSDKPSRYDMLRATQLITHELAHQWFGNIVTMDWWDSVWLNESFSDWATMHSSSQMLSGFDVWMNFLTNDPSSSSIPGFQEALRLDGTNGSHAILDPNIPPSAAFDSIAYLKGCSLMRMLAEDIGVEVFLGGIRKYLDDHSYGNATTEDLWTALSKVSGKDVGHMMDFWTRNVGYPLLKVHELDDETGIVVSQTRFLQNGDTDTNELVYPVTIHIKTADGTSSVLMNKREMTIPLCLSNYKLNADLVGFYRVSYPLSRIQRLGAQFFGDFLSSKDKIGILSDIGAVVATGAPDRELRISDLLDFLLALKHHKRDLCVWREIFSQLKKIQQAFLFEGDETSGILQSVKFALLEPLLRQGHLDFKPDDTTEEAFFKTLLFSQLEDHEEGKIKAKQAWEKLLNGDKDALNPNIRKITFDTLLSLDETDVSIVIFTDDRWLTLLLRIHG
jgi:aminopeptidase 2